MSQWLARALLGVAIVGFVLFGAFLAAFAIRTVCHECLNHPAVIVCENSNDAVYTEIRSNRAHGHMETREVGGCILYYDETNTGVN